MIVAPLLWLRLCTHCPRHDAMYVVSAVMPRQVETGPILKQLENVKNARDLAEACANIRPGEKMCH